MLEGVGVFVVIAFVFGLHVAEGVANVDAGALEGVAYGDGAEAANAYAHSEAVHDTLNKHASQILRSTVREVALQEQSLSRHHFFLVILFSGVIILLFTGGFLTYHVRVQHHRNKAMTQNIRKLMYYRNLVLNQQTKEETADEIVQNEEQEVDALKLRFVEVDCQVMKEELF